MRWQSSADNDSKEDTSSWVILFFYMPNVSREVEEKLYLTKFTSTVFVRSCTESVGERFMICKKKETRGLPEGDERAL